MPVRSILNMSECEIKESGEYELTSHIYAIFIIMVISLLGTLLPITIDKVVKSDKGAFFIQIIKCFGTGVILSTAVIHMLIPAVEMFSNPCLTEVLPEYSGFAGIFILLGILGTHLIQVTAESYARSNKNSTSDDLEASHNHVLVFEQSSKTAVYLLELGIASHSIIVGIALGVATDEFLTLLIALCFHQCFEGMALGAVVSDSKFKGSRISRMMVLIYSLTTPLGIVIGIIIQQQYNDNSVAALMSQGVLEALASGILIYDGLVNIMGPHFSTISFKELDLMNRVVHIISLWGGVITMAVIGIWA